MSKIFLASTFATLVCASLAAQATQTPSPSPSTPALQQPATGGATPQAPTGAPPQTTRSMAKADSIIVEGCIQRGAASGSATSGTTGTSGSAASAFMLTSVTKPAGASGSSASASAPVASSYKLDAASSKLTPHVGHKVEISGTLDSASSSSSSGSAMAAPTLKVDNVKMIAATCTD